MLNKIRNLFGSEFALVIMLILMMASALFFSLIQTVQDPDCSDIVACQYKDKIMPTANVLGLIFFLPVILIFYLQWLNPLIVLLSFVLVVPYWYLLGIFIEKIFCFITRRKIKRVNHELAKEKTQFFFRFSSYCIFVFTIFIGLVSFLYYPNIGVKVEFDQFLLIATAVVAISAYILNNYKGNTSEAYWFRKSVKKLTMATVLFLVMGTFMTFMMSNKAPSVTESIADMAVISAMQTALMGAGILGLTFILFLLINRTPEKLGPKKKVKIIENN